MLLLSNLVNAIDVSENSEALSVSLTQLDSVLARAAPLSLVSPAQSLMQSGNAPSTSQIIRDVESCAFKSTLFPVLRPQGHSVLLHCAVASGSLPCILLLVISLLQTDAAAPVPAHLVASLSALAATLQQRAAFWRQERTQEADLVAALQREAARSPARRPAPAAPRGSRQQRRRGSRARPLSSSFATSLPAATARARARAANRAANQRPDPAPERPRPQISRASVEQLMGMGFPRNRCLRALLRTVGLASEHAEVRHGELALNWLFEHENPALDAPLTTTETKHLREAGLKPDGTPVATATEDSGGRGNDGAGAAAAAPPAVAVDARGVALDVSFVTPGALAQLTELGFPEVRCARALASLGASLDTVASRGRLPLSEGDLQALIVWLLGHADDPDIDVPIMPTVAAATAAAPAPSVASAATTAPVATPATAAAPATSTTATAESLALEAVLQRYAQIASGAGGAAAEALQSGQAPTAIRVALLLLSRVVECGNAARRPWPAESYKLRVASEGGIPSVELPDRDFSQASAFCVQPSAKAAAALSLLLQQLLRLQAPIGAAEGDSPSPMQVTARACVVSVLQLVELNVEEAMRSNVSLLPTAMDVLQQQQPPPTPAMTAVATTGGAPEVGSEVPLARSLKLCIMGGGVQQSTNPFDDDGEGTASYSLPSELSPLVVKVVDCGLPALFPSAQTRAELLSSLLQRHASNPLPPNSPQFTLLCALVKRFADHAPASPSPDLQYNRHRSASARAASSSAATDTASGVAAFLPIDESKPLQPQQLTHISGLCSQLLCILVSQAKAQLQQSLLGSTVASGEAETAPSSGLDMRQFGAQFLWSLCRAALAAAARCSSGEAPSVSVLCAMADILFRSSADLLNLALCLAEGNPECGGGGASAHASATQAVDASTLNTFSTVLRQSFLGSLLPAVLTGVYALSSLPAVGSAMGRHLLPSSLLLTRALDAWNLSDVAAVAAEQRIVVASLRSVTATAAGGGGGSTSVAPDTFDAASALAAASTAAAAGSGGNRDGVGPEALWSVDMPAGANGPSLPWLLDLEKASVHCTAALSCACIAGPAVCPSERSLQLLLRSPLLSGGLTAAATGQPPAIVSASPVTEAISGAPVADGGGGETKGEGAPSSTRSSSAGTTARQRWQAAARAVIARRRAESARQRSAFAAWVVGSPGQSLPLLEWLATKGGMMKALFLRLGNFPEAEPAYLAALLTHSNTWKEARTAALQLTRGRAEAADIRAALLMDPSATVAGGNPAYPSPALLEVGRRVVAMRQWLRSKRDEYRMRSEAAVTEQAQVGSPASAAAGDGDGDGDGAVQGASGWGETKAGDRRSSGGRGASASSAASAETRRRRRRLSGGRRSHRTLMGGGGEGGSWDDAGCARFTQPPAELQEMQQRLRSRALLLLCVAPACELPPQPELRPRSGRWLSLLKRMSPPAAAASAADDGGYDDGYSDSDSDEDESGRRGGAGLLLRGDSGATAEALAACRAVAQFVQQGAVGPGIALRSSDAGGPLAIAPPVSGTQVTVAHVGQHMAALVLLLRRRRQRAHDRCVGVRAFRHTLASTSLLSARIDALRILRSSFAGAEMDVTAASAASHRQANTASGSGNAGAPAAAGAAETKGGPEAEFKLADTQDWFEDLGLEASTGGDGAATGATTSVLSQLGALPSTPARPAEEPHSPLKALGGAGRSAVLQVQQQFSALYCTLCSMLRQHSSADAPHAGTTATLLGLCCALDYGPRSHATLLNSGIVHTVTALLTAASGAASVPLLTPLSSPLPPSPPVVQQAVVSVAAVYRQQLLPAGLRQLHSTLIQRHAWRAFRSLTLLCLGGAAGRQRARHARVTQQLMAELGAVAAAAGAGGGGGGGEGGERLADVVLRSGAGFGLTARLAAAAADDTPLGAQEEASDSVGLGGGGGGGAGAADESLMADRLAPDWRHDLGDSVALHSLVLRALYRAVCEGLHAMMGAPPPLSPALSADGVRVEDGGQQQGAAAGVGGGGIGAVGGDLETEVFTTLRFVLSLSNLRAAGIHLASSPWLQLLLTILRCGDHCDCGCSHTRPASAPTPSREPFRQRGRGAAAEPQSRSSSDLATGWASPRLQLLSVRVLGHIAPWICPAVAHQASRRLGVGCAWQSCFSGSVDETLSLDMIGFGMGFGGEEPVTADLVAPPPSQQHGAQGNDFVRLLLWVTGRSVCVDTLSNTLRHRFPQTTPQSPRRPSSPARGGYGGGGGAALALPEADMVGFGQGASCLALSSVCVTLLRQLPLSSPAAWQGVVAAEVQRALSAMQPLLQRVRAETGAGAGGAGAGGMGGGSGGDGVRMLGGAVGSFSPGERRSSRAVLALASASLWVLGGGRSCLHVGGSVKVRVRGGAQVSGTLLAMDPARNSPHATVVYTRSLGAVAAQARVAALSPQDELSAVRMARAVSMEQLLPVFTALIDSSSSGGQRPAAGADAAEAAAEAEEGGVDDVVMWTGVARTFALRALEQMLSHGPSAAVALRGGLLPLLFGVALQPIAFPRFVSLSQLERRWLVAQARLVELATRNGFAFLGLKSRTDGTEQGGEAAMSEEALARRAAAQQLAMAFGQDVLLCEKALELNRDNADRAAEWLMSGQADAFVRGGGMAREDTGGGGSGGGGADEDGEAARGAKARELALVVGMPPRLCVAALELCGDNKNEAMVWLMDAGGSYAAAMQAQGGGGDDDGGRIGADMGAGGGLSDEAPLEGLGEVGASARQLLTAPDENEEVGAGAGAAVGARGEGFGERKQGDPAAAAAAATAAASAAAAAVGEDDGTDGEGSTPELFLETVEEGAGAAPGASLRPGMLLTVSSVTGSIPRLSGSLLASATGVVAPDGVRGNNVMLLLWEQERGVWGWRRQSFSIDMVRKHTRWFGMRLSRGMEGVKALSGATGRALGSHYARRAVLSLMTNWPEQQLPFSVGAIGGALRLVNLVKLVTASEKLFDQRPGAPPHPILEALRGRLRLALKQEAEEDPAVRAEKERERRRRKNDRRRASQRLQVQQPWSCHMCTFSNPGTATACTMCTTTRRGGGGGGGGESKQAAAGVGSAEAEADAADADPDATLTSVLVRQCVKHFVETTRPGQDLDAVARESLHPFAPARAYTGRVTVQGARALRVTFHRSCDIPRDSLQFFSDDEARHQVATRGGSSSASFQPFVVNSDRVVFKFAPPSSGSEPAWGYRFYVSPVRGLQWLNEEQALSEPSLEWACWLLEFMLSADGGGGGNAEQSPSTSSLHNAKVYDAMVRYSRSLGAPSKDRVLSLLVQLLKQPHLFPPQQLPDLSALRGVCDRVLARVEAEKGAGNLFMPPPLLRLVELAMAASWADNALQHMTAMARADGGIRVRRAAGRRDTRLDAYRRLPLDTSSGSGGLDPPIRLEVPAALRSSDVNRLLADTLELTECLFFKSRLPDPLMCQVFLEATARPLARASLSGHAAAIAAAHRDVYTWSEAQDTQLVACVNRLAAKTSGGTSDLLPAVVGTEAISSATARATAGGADGGAAKFPLLQERGLRSVRFRFALLRLFNSRLNKVIDMLDIANTEVPWSVGYKLRSLGHVIFRDTKSAQLEAAIERTWGSGGSGVQVQLDHQRAFTSMERQQTSPDTSRCLFVQAFRKLHSVPTRKLRSQLDEKKRLFHVSYRGERGVDWGGLYRDGINAMVEDLFSDHLTLFILCPNARGHVGLNQDRYVPNPRAKSPTAIQMFEFVGKLMGISLRTKAYLPFMLPSIVWKQLVRQRLTLSDLEAVDSVAVAQLRTLREAAADPQSTAAEGLRFVTTNSAGQMVEVVAGGVEREVDRHQLPTLCDLILRYRLHEFDDQLRAIRRGIARMVPERALRLFTWSELEQLVGGEVDIDLDMMKRHTQYDGYRKGDRAVRIFWAAMESFSNEDRSQFLRFAWGRSRLPQEGNWPRKFKMSRKGGSAEQLPVAHTCFFQIEWPTYTSEEQGRKKLLTAINYGLGAMLMA